jgi:hypothetical protein
MPVPTGEIKSFHNLCPTNMANIEITNLIYGSPQLKVGLHPQKSDFQPSTTKSDKKNHPTIETTQIYPLQ